jgi:hypothetical protein
VRTGLGAGFVDVAALVYAWGDPDDGRWAVRAVAAVLDARRRAAAALAWMWFGPLAAISATGWLAVSQWHVNYSRWGEMPIMSPLLETVVALCVTLGVRATSWRGRFAWLLAGTALGAGLYTYQTFRLWAPMALAAGAVAAIRHRRALRDHWSAIVAAVLLAALIATPMILYMLQQPGDFGERATGTLIFLRDDWREQLAESVPRSLLAFQFVGDDNPRHNLPFAPLLGWAAATLAPLGLVACAVRWRTPPYAATLLWFGAAMVPPIITLEAPHATRLLDTIVPVALMIGVAVERGAAAVRGALSRRAAIAVALLAAFTALVAMRDEWRTYFVERERLPSFFDAFFPYESASARYLAERAPDPATVYLDPDTYWHPSLPFLAKRYLDQPNDIRPLHVLHDFPPREPLARDALFLLAAAVCVVRGGVAGGVDRHALRNVARPVRPHRSGGLPRAARRSQPRRGRWRGVAPAVRAGGTGLGRRRRRRHADRGADAVRLLRLSPRCAAARAVRSRRVDGHDRGAARRRVPLPPAPRQHGARDRRDARHRGRGRARLRRRP